MLASLLFSFTVGVPSGVRLLPQQIANAKAKAVAGDPAWLALRGWLDANLLAILPGTYQGSVLAGGSAYAIGYQCALATGDATRADQYGRKAAVQLASALHDWQRGAPTRQVIATSDGVTKVFTLPDDPVPATFGAFQSVDATPDNVQTGAPITASLSGRTVTLAAPVAVGHAIAVQYVRRDYTQTGTGHGGLNTITIDSTYTSRFLRHAAHVLDWCSGHPQVEALRVEAVLLFGQWADYLKTNGYTLNALTSNYAVGHYVMRLAMALATNDAVRLADVLAWRTAIMPQFADLAGGFWGEGWNYGELSVAELIDCGLMLSQSETVGFGAAEAAYAAQVAPHLVEARPTPTSVLDIGDGYSWPEPVPGGQLLARVGLPCTRNASDWDGLLFPAIPGTWPTATGRNWNAGAGLVIGAAAGTWSLMLAGKVLPCNHQQYACGHVEVYRNGDCLIANQVAISGLQNPNYKSQNSNVLVADDGGTGLQTYRFNQGTWYGSPGVVVLANEDTASFMHYAVDCRASYSWNQHPGDGGPLSQWVRHWLLWKGDGTVIVCDHYALKTAACTAVVPWNLSPGPFAILTGPSFIADRGGSRVQGTILSGDPVTLTQALAGTYNPQVPRLTGSTGKLSGVIVSVFQMGPSGAFFLSPVYWTDGTRQGCTLAGRTFAFSSNGSMTVA